MEHYYIYHIPNFVHSDGSIGKIGQSIRPKKRVKEQGYSEYEILEVHTDKNIAAEREIELQKQFGYKVDSIKYNQINYQKMGLTVGKMNAESGRVVEMGRASAKKQWNENRELQIEKSKKGGEISKIMHSKKVEQCDLNWNVIKTFDSTKDAARYMNGHASTIRGTILSKGTYKGFRWKYPNP